MTSKFINSTNSDLLKENSDADLRPNIFSGLYLIIILVVGIIIAFLYLLLINSKYTQQISLQNFNYVNLLEIFIAVVLGLSIGLTVSIQVASIRILAKSSHLTNLPFFSMIAAILPSLACCSPLLGTLFATLGLGSLFGLSSTRIQYLSGRYSVIISLVATGVAVVSALYALKKFKSSTCESCTVTRN